MTKLQFKTMVLILCQVFWNSSIFEPSTYWYSSHNSVMSSSLIICFFLCLSFQEYYCTVYPLFLFLFMFQSLMLRQDVVKYTLSYVKICKTDRTCVQVVGVCVCVCMCACTHACVYACMHIRVWPYVTWNTNIVQRLGVHCSLRAACSACLSLYFRSKHKHKNNTAWAVLAGWEPEGVTDTACRQLHETFIQD